jgi:hypothetical protein
MFTHKVIDSLLFSDKLFFGYFEKYENFELLKNTIIKSLKKSHIFNFGNSSDVYNVLGVSLDNVMDYGEVCKKDKQYIKIPYDTCVFEVTYDSGFIDPCYNTINYNYKQKYVYLLNKNNEGNIVINIFIGDIDKKDLFFMIPFNIELDLQDGNEGSVNINTYTILHKIKRLYKERNKKDPQLVDLYFSYLYEFINLAKLLCCKNIVTEKNYPPKALNKKRISQGKHPLFTYYTLSVCPIGMRRDNNKEHNETGIKQRLHFCRGHFKEYTKENPLFGKATGLYWWQPQIRGNKDLGYIHKDYSVCTKN